MLALGRFRQFIEGLSRESGSMSAKTLIQVMFAAGLGSLTFFLTSTDVYGQKTSPETQKLREGLNPTAAPAFGSGNAADLAPLNPDPVLLDLPKDESDVVIDLSQPITLEEALILARRNNRDLQVAELEVKAAEARLAEAKSDRLPTVGVSGRFTRNQTLIDQDDIIVPGVNQLDATAQAQYDILTNGQRPANIQAAREDLESSNLELKIELWQLRLDVTNDYFDLQQADELITIAESAVENARDSFENTVALEQAGLGTRFDVLRSEVQLADREQQLTQAKGQKEIAQRQLAQRLSLADNTTITASDPVQEAGRWPLSLAESITAAQTFRAELAQILTEREIAVLNEKIAKNSLGPFLSASGTVTAGGSALDRVSPNAFNPNPDLLSGDVGYSIGAEANYTLFDGGRSKAQARQQAVSTQIAETQFDNTKNVIRFQIELNYSNLTSSLQNIATNRKAVEQAKQSLELAKLRFREGIGTQLEVSNEETSLTRSESNLLQAIIDYNRALIGLQRFVADPQLQLLPFNTATASRPNHQSQL